MNTVVCTIESAETGHITGNIYQMSGWFYILARVSTDSWALINLATGYRYKDAVGSTDAAVDGAILVSRNATITIS